MDSLRENIFSTGAQKLLTEGGRLETWHAGGSPIPVTLEIQPTERCSHRCPGCQARFSLSLPQVRQQARSGADLDLRLLESIWEQPPAGVVISGNTGDPLLYPDLIALLERLQQAGIPVALVTNGEMMTAALAEHIVRACEGVRVSLDACDADSFRRTHGVKAESWERVLLGIRELVAARSRAGHEGANCLIGAGYLTDERTRGGMLQATRLARSLGMDYIQFRPFHYQSANVGAELEACVIEERPGFRVFSSSQKYGLLGASMRSYSQCHGAWFYTVLDARGDLYICCHHVGRPEARLGSLREKSWPEFTRSLDRRQGIQAFSVAHCLPLCRLHVHNEALERLRQGAPPPTIELNEEVRRHVGFL